MLDTIGILYDGYDHFRKKFSESEKDIIEAHFLFKKIIVLKGVEAAKIFYDHTKFKRNGATPKRFQKTLFGEGGVQGLDAQAHTRRKKLFMQVMSAQALKKIEKIFKEDLRNASNSWEKKGEIVLFPEMELVLMRTACQWAGVPLKREEEELRTRQMHKMIASSGAVGLKHYHGRSARSKSEAWIESLIDRQSYRNNSIFGLFISCLYRPAQPESKNVTAVEILNLLRPIVAVARYLTFLAHAKYLYPAYLYKKKNDADEKNLQFVQEVRRFYPFFPFVAAKVIKDFSWNHYDFKKDQKVLLDIYSTNHDPNYWVNPEKFNPKRFSNWEENPYSFIPQGGGYHEQHHRCAGEWITIGLMQTALKFLSDMSYDVPHQNLNIKLNKIPAIPESRFRISNIRTPKSK